MKFLLNKGEESSPSREEVYAEIFPDRPFDGGQMNKLQNSLVNKALDFMAFQQLKGEIGLQHALRLAYLNRSPEAVSFEKAYKKASKLTGGKSRDEKSLGYRLQYEIENTRYQLRFPTSKIGAIFDPVLDTLEEYYWLKRLKIVCAGLNMDAILGTTHEKTRIGEIPEELFANPLILVYHLVYRILTEEEWKSSFQDLFQMITTQSTDIPQSALDEPIRYLINFALRRINVGELDQQEQVAALYEWLFDRSDKQDKKLVEPGDLKNYVNILCRLGQLDRAETALEKYIPRLSSTQKGNLPLYLQALIDFTREDHRACMQGLDKMLNRTDNVFLQLDGRLLLWKTYYLLGEKDPDLFDLASFNFHDTFRKYVVRKKNASQSHKDNYRNFANLFLSLLKCQLESVTEKRKACVLKLEDKIRSTTDVASRHWLLEQCAQTLDSMN